MNFQGGIMPQPKVAIDYQACDPSLCNDNVCASAQVCERKVLRQVSTSVDPEIPFALLRMLI